MKRKVTNLIIFILFLLLTGCTTTPSILSPSAQVDGKEAVQKTLVAPEPKIPHIETIILTATGDILMHNTQFWGAQQNDGSYNFNSFFTPVEHLIKAGDYASTNFEAPMAGPEAGYSSYPLFNSPDAIADAFKNSGFDLVVTANNHILDQGYKGALRTLEVLKKASLDTTGCFSSPEAQYTPLIKTIRGIKVGYIAYTYGINGIPLPKNAPYLVNILNPDKVIADISSLRPEVDILILVLHWGEEYSQHPTIQQKDLARRFLEAGADAILGSHPHVLNPLEVMNINDKRKFVIYSMGNFISAQNGMERNSGIVLNLEFEKDFDANNTILTQVSYAPTYSHPYRSNGKLQYRVVPVLETIQQIKAGTEPFLTTKDLDVLEKVLEQTRNLLGKDIIQLSTHSNS